MLNSDINSYLNTLINEVNGIESIWLIGSRANGTANPGSDWDFMVFGKSEISESIKENSKFHRDDVDLLVVKSDGTFSKPYGSPKSGNLDSWGWQKIDENTAKYEVTKMKDFDPNGDGFVGDNSPFVEETLNAFRVKSI